MIDMTKTMRLTEIREVKTALQLKWFCGNLPWFFTYPDKRDIRLLYFGQYSHKSGYEIAKVKIC